MTLHETTADQSTPPPVEDLDTPEISDAARDAAAAETTAPDLQAQLDALNDQYVRLAADFENFRRRANDERASLLKYGAERTVNELIPILDNLERAAQSLSENSEPAMLYKSFAMMRQQLISGLESGGLTTIAQTGVPFDPTQHEAASQQPSADHPDGTVLQIFQTGYQLHDRVLRPAMVVVSTADAPVVSADAATANPFATNP